MNINVEYVGLDASDALSQFTNKKIAAAFKNYSYITNCHVFFKSENADVEDRIVEIQLNVPNQELYADAKAESYEEALTESISKVKRQLHKYREKMQSH